MIQDIEAIVRQYADMVYRLARVQTHNRQDAEDVFQEVFLRLTKYQDKLQEEEKLRYWLVRVTINCSHSLYTTGWRQHEIPAETLPENTENTQPGMENTVYDALCTLPEKYRSALHLFYYERLSIRDIARIQQCSEGNVKSLLSRGRKRLETKLREEGASL